MHPLVREALNITREIGPVTFVGAVAVFLHTTNTRESRDLDFAIAKPITNEELLDKDYKIFSEGGKEKIYTPRNYKIDIYADKPLNRIPIQTIIETSHDFPVNKRSDIVNGMGLEALILSKFRSNRPEVDYQDLRGLAIEKRNDVKLPMLRNLADDEHEVTEIMNTLRFLAS